MNQSKPDGHATNTKTGNHAAETEAAGEAKPMGTPTSDRHHSETASTEHGGDAATAKHDHGVDGRTP